MNYPSIKLALICLIFGLSACSTSGGQQAAGDQAAPPAEREMTAEEAEAAAVAAAFDPRVCKRFAPTGTRISKKVCKKQSEWDALRANAQEGGADAQRRAVYSNATK